MFALIRELWATFGLLVLAFYVPADFILMAQFPDLSSRGPYMSALIVSLLLSPLLMFSAKCFFTALNIPAGTWNRAPIMSALLVTVFSPLWVPFIVNLLLTL